MLEVYGTDYNNANHLTAFSGMGWITSSDPGVAGFIIQGSGHKKLLIRGVGPALTGSVTTPLSDPGITIWAHSTIIPTNNDWSSELNSSAISAAATTLGLTALGTGSADAAILIDLPPGAYTVHLNVASGSSGTGQLQIYEL